MGALLAATGFALLLTLEYLPDVASRVLYCCLSLSCLLISASSTYGLGGFLFFGSGQRQDSVWQFFQPFAGGPAFVATQVRACLDAEPASSPARGARRWVALRAACLPARRRSSSTNASPPPRSHRQMQAISWSLFSATIVAVGLLLKQMVAGVAACVRCWALSVGALMLMTQAMLALSLLTYRVRALPGGLPGGLPVCAGARCAPTQQASSTPPGPAWGWTSP
jgi:hypothetical protein